nr:hypothetical protein [Tanacetum cinerariifolium]
MRKELGDSLVRAAITASSLKVEQDSGNITKTQSKTTPNEPSSQGTDSSGGPMYQETIGDTSAQTRLRVYLNILMIHCSQEGRRIDAIDVDDEITLVNDADNEMFDVDDIGGEEVFVARQNDNVVEEVVNAAQVSTAVTTTTITTEEITLAQALEALKFSKPKLKGIIFQEPCISKTTKTTTISSQQSQDKGKGIKIEEPGKPKKKDQIRLNEEAALKLQAEFDKEERLQKVEDDKKKVEIKQLMETILDEEEVAIDAITLDVKSPRIVNRKIHKEGKKSYYQMVRADGKSQMYMIFSQMLKSFNRKDLEDLYKLSMQIYMLVEKKYHLTPPTLSMMLEKKL